MSERRGAYRSLVRKPEEKTQLGGPTLGSVNNIETDKRNRIGWGVD
jgi:hypothetical protein